MTIDQFIFEKLWPDECWHTYKQYACSAWHLCCTKCEVFCEQDTTNPDFSTGDGMLKLKRRLIELDRINEFSQWAWEIRDPRLIIDPESQRAFWEEPYLMWFWGLVEPLKLRDLVGEFLGWKEEK